MTIFRATVIFALVLPVPIQAKPKDDIAKTLQLPKGWECLQGPNDLDHPGRAFYIDKSGARYEFADVGTAIAAESGDLSAVSSSKNGKMSAGLLAKILSIGSLLSVSFNKTYTTAVTLTQRQEFRTDEAHTQRALRSLDPALMSQDNTYYVIRNTQVAKQMKWTVDRSVAGAFGGEVPFTNGVTVAGAAPTPAPSPTPSPSPSPAPSPTTGAASTTGSASANIGSGKAPSVTAGVAFGAGTKPTATPTVSTTPSTPSTILSLQDARTYAIDQTYAKPMTVCFLAQKFTIKNVTGGAGGSIHEVTLENEYYNPSNRP